MVVRLKHAGGRELRPHVRAIRAAHLPAARRLCGRALPEAKPALGLLATCASGRKDDADSMGLVAHAGERLAGVLCCRVVRDPVLAPAEERVAHLDMVVVSPQCRRRGVATALLRQMERRLLGRGVRSVWTRSNPLGPGVDLVQYPEAVVLLVKLGFAKRNDIYDLTGYLSRLDVDTCALERQLAQAGVEVKRIEPSEGDALRRFLVETFPHWAGVADGVAAHGPQCVHVARAGDEMIGFATSSGGGFGPIGVHPDRRLAGVGKCLLLRCLRDVRERGHDTAFIGWANFPFYMKTISSPVTRIMWQMEKKL